MSELYAAEKRAEAAPVETTAPAQTDPADAWAEPEEPADEGNAEPAGITGEPKEPDDADEPGEPEWGREDDAAVDPGSGGATGLEARARDGRPAASGEDTYPAEPEDPESPVEPEEPQGPERPDGPGDSDEADGLEGTEGAETPEESAEAESPEDRAGVSGGSAADEPSVTGKFMDRVKGAFSSGDSVREISETVDRPDFHLPGRAYPPDAYGTPLDRPDGTRTPLFDGIPNRDQTQQGALGDCGVIATLGAVAEHRPQDIIDRIKENEDGTYEVSLNEAKSVGFGRYEPTGTVVKLTVTGDLPVYSEIPSVAAFADSAETGVAWAPIMEKAIAGVDRTWSEDKQASWQSTHARTDASPTGYTRLNFGTKSSDRAELLVQLTGTPAQVWDVPTGYDHHGRDAKTQFRQDIAEKLADGCPVIVATRHQEKGESPLPGKLVAGHAYELTAINEIGRFELRNPYNARDPQPLTFDELRDSILPNYVTLEKK
ncbi:hypothetical protein [Streptomyces sp. NPDC048481]|uniref:hypothetical protein n=1 Tax=Streptomyces sp. NPDC048481 TaxID=3365557 RepID=UPI00371BD157